MDWVIRIIPYLSDNTEFWYEKRTYKRSHYETTHKEYVQQTLQDDRKKRTQ